ncbi:MAG TPA: tRNA (guanosine(46)-N7)-methyltransferase TrmB [Steroidobacteraceae bacterium]
MPTSKPQAAGPDPRPHRAVRSFVVRAGRMTGAQERAWRELWPRLGVEAPDTPLDLDALFGRSARRTVEIGFGNGESLVALAASCPHEDFLGLEVHRPGVGHLMLRCEELEIRNLRIACRDAVEVLERQLAPSCIDELLLYFPDPWPKKRHHKRRLVQEAFVELVASRLRSSGVFRLATDWQPYAEHMLDTLRRSTQFRNESPHGSWVPRPASRPPTRFELRGQRLGHQVWDLAFRKI